MTSQNYRTLLIASVAFGLMGGLFDLIVPSALPEAFSAAQESHDDSLSDSQLIFAAIVCIPLGIAVLASTIGLYLFRHWAPKLALATTVPSIALSVLTGPIVFSGWSIALTETSSILWGAVLAITYFSPMKDRFIRIDR